MWEILVTSAAVVIGLTIGVIAFICVVVSDVGVEIAVRWAGGHTSETGPWEYTPKWSWHYWIGHEVRRIRGVVNGHHWWEYGSAKKVAWDQLRDMYEK